MDTQTELKEKGHQVQKPMGVFQIQNKVNQKVYIACSTDLDGAWEAEKFNLNIGIHPYGTLQSDWHKMGPDNFEFSVIEQLSQSEAAQENAEDVLSARLDAQLDRVQPFDDKGYNRKH
ncbi:MAG: GIY-YIG nuclease family protein [Mucilaginibacter polytrichastri]|nr:GIY-YIG nuclease family protein [Mucilaginibacter polytrichastri]